MTSYNGSLDLAAVSHVGFSVMRLEQFIDTWGTALGVEDWVIRDDVDQFGVRVAGVTQDLTRLRLAFAQIGGACLELVQTLAGQTCEAQSAAAIGPGLHHIAFWVENLDREARKAQDLGLRLVEAPSALIARLSSTPESVADATRDAARNHRPFRDISLNSFLDMPRAGMNFTLELLDMRLLDDYQRLTGEKSTRPGKPVSGAMGV
jgi:methylmalonyl-CoA/ethylmalonyl-CoA epimerase